IVRITRVKVGNRQAPQQQTETPPRKGGVSAFTMLPYTEKTHRITPPYNRLHSRPIRRASA
ncbi:hypothetical protein, partial [Paraburkholderia sp. BL25I1N1]|uniref:hypothetical protein n=1 Tax=Paraburkholderia sp. BL25I1N1 TaxID=1938804 RepID=UPI001C6272C1